MGGKEESINISRYFLVTHKTFSRQIPFTMWGGVIIKAPAAVNNNNWGKH